MADRCQLNLRLDGRRDLLDISQKEMVDRALLNYNGILPQKHEPTPRIY